MTRPTTPGPTGEDHANQPPLGRSEPLPIVGIGASAGGLQALRRFFSEIPEDCGVAFVVVVHLSPDHESHLPELLQASSKLPVEQVKQTTPLQTNRVYIIPPGANLDAVDTHLRLSQLEERRSEREPIDHFFRTLAETHDGHAVGIVLTGNGSDGSKGLRAIKVHGGLTIAQDPRDAEYDGMPRSAIASGCADVVLPLAQIPAAALRLAKARPRVLAEAEEAQTQKDDFLPQIFAQIRSRTGREFGLYKRSTVIRRVARRMRFPIRHFLTST